MVFVTFICIITQVDLFYLDKYIKLSSFGRSWFSIDFFKEINLSVVKSNLLNVPAIIIN